VLNHGMLPKNDFIYSSTILLVVYVITPSVFFSSMRIQLLFPLPLLYVVEGTNRAPESFLKMY
jgi:hypothetical protein